MIGFIIGVFVGAIFGVVIMALLSFHKLTEYEEEILKLRRRVAELEEKGGSERLCNILKGEWKS